METTVEHNTQVSRLHIVLIGLNLFVYSLEVFVVNYSVIERGLTYIAIN